MSDESVYNLITQLCEKYSNSDTKTKQLRSQSYEILLGKRTFENAEKLIQHPNVINELYSWQFTLAHQYGLVEDSQKLTQLAPKIVEDYDENVLRFMLCLKRPPDDDDDDIALDLCDEFKKLFNIPLVRKPPQAATGGGERGPASVWELAARLEGGLHKTWESYGQPAARPERPFASEIGDRSRLLVEGRLSVFLAAKRLSPLGPKKPRVLRMRELVKHLKYLLLGMGSSCFPHAGQGFALAPNLAVGGVSPLRLRSFCEDFVRAGGCFRALTQMADQAGLQSQNGYIHTEFCHSLARYFQFYRTFVFQLDESEGLVKIGRLTRKVREQVVVLAEICQLGPFQAGERLSYGVRLLNRLFVAINRYRNREHVFMVLYSSLFACYQVYFHRFLQQWLLDGVLDDPYDEFFVKLNAKYASTRGRTYWTRSYSVEDNLVPEFLSEHKMEVLNCGRAMNLLKLSARTNGLCMHLMGKKPLIVSCCVTSQQLLLLEQNITQYYLEIFAECGPGLDLGQLVEAGRQQDPRFMALIAKRRVLFIQKRELERKKRLMEERESKMEKMAVLREQYDAVLQQKEERVAQEIASDLKLIEFNLSIQEARDRLIETESKILIDYYEELFAISENRKKKIENHIKILKETILPPIEASSSTESFYSAGEPAEAPIEAVEAPLAVVEPVETLEKRVVQEPHHPALDHSEILDILNANAVAPAPAATDEARHNKTRNLASTFNLYSPVNDNRKKSAGMETFAAARRNKAKVMSEELDLFMPLVRPPRKLLDNFVMSELERNRQRVLGSDIQIIESTPLEVKTNASSLSLANAPKPPHPDANWPKPDRGGGECRRLPLELGRCEPMSVDSTPLSDSSRLPTRSEPGSLPSTALTDSGEPPGAPEPAAYVIGAPGARPPPGRAFSKRCAPAELAGVHPGCLRFLLAQSVAMPLRAHAQLVNNELLRHYVVELGFLRHLQSLRSYFFLQDGEFGRSITEQLFERLYAVQRPADLVNGRTLQALVFEAMEKCQSNENRHLVSFKINYVPEVFELCDPNALNCLSLCYRVVWPLNVLLPSDTVEKYDRIFKFLLKLNRVAWVLKRIGLDLKMLAKSTGRKEIYLMVSPHYRKFHQCRHVMLHFVQTLQNYILGEVLQTSFMVFEQSLEGVGNIEEIYLNHTIYIKNILFLCLLNPIAAPIRKVIEKIFRLILTFYDTVRSCEWCIVDGEFVHPKFAKLERIYANYETHLIYLFNAGKKIASSGYQPHFKQFLYMLDISWYYTNKTRNV